MALTKTEAGHRVLKDRSIALNPRQRTALILLDGKRRADEVLAASGAAPDDLAQLEALGLVEPTAGAATMASAGTAQASAAAGTAAARATTPVGLGTEAPSAASGAPAKGSTYMEAYQLATRLTAGLGLKGFRLNLAVEAASSFEDIVALAPRIRDAVGAEKFAPLEALIRGS